MKSLNPLLSLLQPHGNIYILSTHQTLTLGGSSFDYGQFMVLFNAAMIMIIYAVDFVIVRQGSMVKKSP